MTKTERNIRRLVKSLGGALLTLEQTKHFRARIQRPDGSELTHVFAVSPSDSYRGAKNAEAQLKKQMTGETR